MFPLPFCGLTHLLEVRRSHPAAATTVPAWLQKPLETSASCVSGKQGATFLQLKSVKSVRWTGSILLKSDGLCVFSHQRHSFPVGERAEIAVFARTDWALRPWLWDFLFLLPRSYFSRDLQSHLQTFVGVCFICTPGHSLFQTLFIREIKIYSCFLLNNNHVLGIRYQVLGIGIVYWALGIRYQVSGIWYLESGIGISIGSWVSGIRHWVSGIGYCVSGIGYQALGIWYWVSGFVYLVSLFPKSDGLCVFSHQCHSDLFLSVSLIELSGLDCEISFFTSSLLLFERPSESFTNIRGCLFRLYSRPQFVPDSVSIREIKIYSCFLLNNNLRFTFCPSDLP